MEITKESWDALIAGQCSERQSYQVRLCKMAKKIERLSIMLEQAYDFYITPEYGATLEDAEDSGPL